MKQHDFTNSSQVNKIRYFADDKALEIVFKNNKTYRYSGVPETVYEGAIAAESVGKYINAHVKNEFPYLQLPF